MGSENVSSVPVIDFSSPVLEPGTPEWHSIATQVREAAEEYGCFPELNKAIVDGLKEFFDLPIDTKRSVVSEIPYAGYTGQLPFMPLYESVGINGATKLEEVESLAKLLWPQGNSSFRQAIHSLSMEASNMDKMIRKMIAGSMGVGKYMDEQIKGSNYFGLAMKFEGPKVDEGKLGAGAHADKTLVSIVHQNQVDAWEVQTKDGRWIQVKLSPDFFAVLIGETFHAWSNGRLRATAHRVMISPDELVVEDHPLLFKPFDYQEFMSFYVKQIVNRADSSLMAYCGV